MELRVTWCQVDEAGLHLGALGTGKIFHPTKVQINFKFVGTDAIEHGYKLEQAITTWAITV